MGSRAFVAIGTAFGGVALALLTTFARGAPGRMLLRAHG